MMVRNRPMIAALMITLGLSVKATGIFMLPVFLGWVQMQHGTLVLLACFLIILGLQVFVASPFVFDSAAYAMGFKAGANTTFKDYIEKSKFLGGELGKVNHGAAYSLSIYWQFMPNELYDTALFCNTLKLL